MSAHEALRTYTAKELEQIAAEQIRRLKERGDLSIPVDIEMIVEQFHGIEIDVHRGLKERHHVWGVVGRLLESDKMLILVDDQLIDQDHLHKLYRMTVAEELAHAILHGNAIRKVKTVDDFLEFQKHIDWDRHDRNAKRLAAALLMPAQHVLQDARGWYSKLVTLVGYGSPDVIKKHLSGKLAEDYEVSLSAMRYRLGEWPMKIYDRIDAAVRDRLDFLE